MEPITRRAADTMSCTKRGANGEAMPKAARPDPKEGRGPAHRERRVRAKSEEAGPGGPARGGQPEPQ